MVLPCGLQHSTHKNLPYIISYKVSYRRSSWAASECGLWYTSTSFRILRSLNCTCRTIILQVSVETFRLTIGSTASLTYSTEPLPLPVGLGFSMLKSWYPGSTTSANKWHWPNSSHDSIIPMTSKWSVANKHRNSSIFGQRDCTFPKITHVDLERRSASLKLRDVTFRAFSPSHSVDPGCAVSLNVHLDQDCIVWQEPGSEDVQISQIPIH